MCFPHDYEKPDFSKSFNKLIETKYKCLPQYFNINGTE